MPQAVSTTLVNLAAVPDCVDDDGLLVSEDFEDNAVGAFSQLEQTAQFPLERLQSCRFKVGSNPLNTICDSLRNGPIELLQLFGGRLENADGVQ